MAATHHDCRDANPMPAHDLSRDATGHGPRALDPDHARGATAPPARRT